MPGTLATAYHSLVGLNGPMRSVMVPATVVARGEGDNDEAEEGEEMLLRQGLEELRD